MIFLVQAQHRIFQAFLTAARSTMRGWRLRLLLQGTFLTFANLAYAQFQIPCFATPSDEEVCCDDTETERSDCFDFIYTAVERWPSSILMNYFMLHRRCCSSLLFLVCQVGKVGVIRLSTKSSLLGRRPCGWRARSRSRRGPRDWALRTCS